jgi:hypothetical protein
LLGEDIQFSDANVDAVRLLKDGQFNQAAYEHFWFQKNILNHLQKIIHAELDIDDIEQQAMLATFQYGQDYKKG